MFKTFVSIVSAALFIFCHSAFAQQQKMKFVVKGQLPPGFSFQQNKITLKKGYVFEKVSSTRAIARIRGGGTGITGEFDCTCNGSQGGCSVVTTPNSVTCASSGCSSCYMIVTIPDKTPTQLMR